MATVIHLLEGGEQSNRSTSCNRSRSCDDDLILTDVVLQGDADVAPELVLRGLGLLAGQQAGVEGGDEGAPGG